MARLSFSAVARWTRRSAYRRSSSSALSTPLSAVRRSPPHYSFTLCNSPHPFSLLRILRSLTVSLFCGIPLSSGVRTWQRLVRADCVADVSLARGRSREKRERERERGGEKKESDDVGFLDRYNGHGYQMSWRSRSALMNVRSVVAK